MQHCVRADGCSPTRCLGTTFCASRRSGRPSGNDAREKSGMFLEKDCTEPGKNSVAGAGPLGRSGGREGLAGMAGRAEMGAGAVPGRRGGRGDVRVPT